MDDFSLLEKLLPGVTQQPCMGLFNWTKRSCKHVYFYKDHRGELYKKHYPPALHDEVWRLDRIAKDGALHKKLMKSEIITVEDFLRILVRDPQRLRNILGSGMSNRMWDNTVEHAKTCVLGGKLYIYYANGVHSAGRCLQPDLEFGSFSVICCKTNSDPKSMAILRVTFGESQKKNEGPRPDQQHSSKLLFQQLQSHFNQQQEFHVYTLLSKQQALELMDVRGGDEVRLDYLCENLGVKLIGRKGLGPSADSIIASIKAERGKRKPTSTSLTLKSGMSKLKLANSKQKFIRKAKILGNNKGSTTLNKDLGPGSTNKDLGPGSTNKDLGLKILAMEMIRLPLDCRKSPALDWQAFGVLVFSGEHFIHFWWFKWTMSITLLVECIEMFVYFVDVCLEFVV